MPIYFGAGWVYLGKEPSKVEVINDIDKELINLFRMTKYHASEIERMLEYEFSGRDIFEEYKNVSVKYLTEIHRASPVKVEIMDMELLEDLRHRYFIRIS